MLVPTLGASLIFARAADGAAGRRIFDGAPSGGQPVRVEARFSWHSGSAAIVGTKADCARTSEGRSMRALLLTALGVALFWSLPAAADHWHVTPYFGFGIGVGG